MLKKYVNVEILGINNDEPKKYLYFVGFDLGISRMSWYTEGDENRDSPAWEDIPPQYMKSWGGLDYTLDGRCIHVNQVPEQHQDIVHDALTKCMDEYDPVWFIEEEAIFERSGNGSCMP
jgi:hypothetical protein